MFKATVVIENSTTGSKWIDSYVINDEIVNTDGLFAVIEQSVNTYVNVQNEIMNESLLQTVEENVRQQKTPN